MATKSSNSKNASNKKNVVLGWHFLAPDRRLGEGDGRLVQLGQTLTMKYNNTQTPGVCSYGMHASPKISAAAKYTKGPVLCRVEVWGDVDDARSTDKFCGRHRRVIWWKELTKAEMAAATGKLVGNKTVDDLVSDMYYTNANTLDTNLEALAKKHGWDDAQNAKNPTGDVTTAKFIPVKPELDEKTVLSLLDKRFVRTRHEIEKQLGGAFDMSNADDVFDDLEMNGDAHVIENFTKDGANGYLRVSR